MGTLGAPVAQPSPSLANRSEWHSPVPYLFAGLSAMLGLIAFALLVLACSFWKLSRFAENRENGAIRDLEAEAAGGGDGGAKPAPPVVEEVKYLVIMAGQEKPTFLATPMSSRASSFGSTSSVTTSSSENTLPLEED